MTAALVYKPETNFDIIFLNLIIDTFEKNIRSKNCHMENNRQNFILIKS